MFDVHHFLKKPVIRKTISWTTILHLDSNTFCVYDFVQKEGEMKSASQSTIRRSIAVPNELVEELRTVAPPELRDNFNRLVTFILMDFTRRQKKYQFEAAMAEMANDPAIQEVSAGLSEEFTETENDGL